MRIMLDTNILISALLFPSKQMEELFRIITTDHKMVLSSYVVDELYDVVKRKFSNKVIVIEALLSQMSYELVYTPKNFKKPLVKIRDNKDYPVIHTAIVEEVDILLSGDKDFQDLDIGQPRVLTPIEFLKEYSNDF